jgi:tetratricopeptide (TPR) repeat protein
MPKTPRRPTADDAAARAIETGFLEAVHRRLPGDARILQALADTCSQAGEHLRAREYDLALTRLRPRDPLARYNYACSCALTGERTEALVALEEALRLGYRDFDHALEDEDLAGLRNDEAFPRWLSRLAAARDPGKRE